MKQRDNHIELTTAVDLSAVASFYDTVGYRGGVHSDDRVLVARADREIVGAVRLCEENNTLVLRGMYVTEGLRGQGLGALLLEFTSNEIGQAECWCVPYVHLTKFYSRIGFLVCETDAIPEFLVDRQSWYTDIGLAVTIMQRRAQQLKRLCGRYTKKVEL